MGHTLFAINSDSSQFFAGQLYIDHILPPLNTRIIIASSFVVFTRKSKGSTTLDMTDEHDGQADENIASSLEQATLEGNIPRLKELLLSGVSVSTPISSREFTALHLAVSSGNEAMVKTLIDAGANVSAQTYDGVTPLHNAAADNSVELAKLLLGAGADAKSCNSDNETPLHVAALFGGKRLASLLIDAGCDISAKDCYGNTALHIAAAHESLELVQFLLSSGADPNAVNNNEDTVLHHAVADGPDSVELLLENGADIHSPGQFGDTLLHRAAQSSASLLQVFLNAGADHTAVNDYGYTPLHQAAAYGDIEQIQILLDAGAGVKATTKNEETVLHLLAGDLDMSTGMMGEPKDASKKARLFIDAGVDINAIAVGQTALSRAQRCGHSRVAETLRERGALE